MEFDIILEAIMADQPPVEREFGDHSPADPDTGSPAYDVTLNGTYPKDVYSYVGLRYYGTGEPAMDSQAYGILQRLKNHPNHWLTVYRAVPKNVKGGIKPGDWVTTIRRYAVEHGKASLRNDYRIISKLVTARDIFTAGDSWLEWGYFPQPFIPKSKILTTNEYQKSLTESIGDMEKVQMEIARNCPCSRSDIHGEEHWRRVEKNGLEIAKMNGADEDVIRLFAYLHDCQRENEDTDPLHGPRAAAYARKIRYTLPIDDEQFKKLLKALTYHTSENHNDDPTVGACFDADRLDLGRVGITSDPSLLNTDEGKRIAVEIKHD